MTPIYRASTAPTYHHSTSTLFLPPSFLTSIPGIPVKKFTGFNPTTVFSHGITGQSSTCGLCTLPNVCQITISSFLTSVLPFTASRSYSAVALRSAAFLRALIQDAIPSPTSRLHRMLASCDEPGVVACDPEGVGGEFGAVGVEGRGFWEEHLTVVGD
jgi:hypothetical protein